MISSIDLFFKRDAAGGAGPTVEADMFGPCAAFVGCAMFDACAAPAVVGLDASCAGAWEALEAVAGCLPRFEKRLEVGAGAEEVGAEVVVALAWGLPRLKALLAWAGADDSVEADVVTA